jgi:hypothetical protein
MMSNSSVIPGRREAPSPEPMNTRQPVKLRTATRSYPERCSWVPGSLLRNAPE